MLKELGAFPCIKRSVFVQCQDIVIIDVFVALVCVFEEQGEIREIV